MSSRTGCLIEFFFFLKKKRNQFYISHYNPKYSPSQCYHTAHCVFLSSWDINTMISMLNVFLLLKYPSIFVQITLIHVLPHCTCTINNQIMKISFLVMIVSFFLITERTFNRGVRQVRLFVEHVICWFRSFSIFFDSCNSMFDRGESFPFTSMKD